MPRTKSVSSVSPEQWAACCGNVQYIACPLYAKAKDDEHIKPDTTRCEAVGGGFKRGTAFGADTFICLTCVCIPFRCLESALACQTKAIVCGCDPSPHRQPVSSRLNWVCAIPGALCGAANAIKSALCFTKPGTDEATTPIFSHDNPMNGNGRPHTPSL